VFRVPFIEGVC
jgi:hypothetical protein